MIGKCIKVTCHNGFIQEGIVEQFSDDRMDLKLIDGSTLILLNPKTHIFTIHVFGEVQDKPKAVAKDTTELEAKEKFSHELRFKSLAELHKLKAHEEQRTAKELLTSKSISTIAPEVKFEYPNFGSLRQPGQPLPKRPKKKARSGAK
jgi:hypothetical protein